MPAYLIGAAFFLLVWALFYAFVPRVRSETLLASVALTPFGPLLEYTYLGDYWTPEYVASAALAGVPIALEDCLFGFALSGLTTGIFALLLPLPVGCIVRRATAHTWWRLQAVAAMFVLANCLLTEVVGLNSVHATITVCVLGSAWIYAKRPSWLKAGLTAGCVTAVLFLCFYEFFFLQLYPTIIDDWWWQSALSGLRLRRVPVEEIAWGFAMGFFIGPLVRLCASVSPAFAVPPLCSTPADVPQSTASHP